MNNNGIYLHHFYEAWIRIPTCKTLGTVKHFVNWNYLKNQNPTKSNNGLQHLINPKNGQNQTNKID